MNILEEIASENTLAMTDRVILLQLMICSVSSFGYYKSWLILFGFNMYRPVSSILYYNSG
ncbi:MAG: hypothetical protein JETT_2305 [Candidatus Jettenia ecosi]|uniref:Uncharacterized protein n=1 Tax=Candidatus Jettenia ecosi TaxID=2494326 RepID=A0A533Q9N8_9BACT|nr:MAG: hypothetical protein JETT_2305 [Candidatus Jettenia ecosi]